MTGEGASFPTATPDDRIWLDDEAQRSVYGREMVIGAKWIIDLW
jgi:hypothetical protein